MKSFDIHPVNRSLEQAIQAKIDNLNKPKGSLGRLEELAMQVCLVQQTLEPGYAGMLGSADAGTLAGSSLPSVVGW